MSFNIGLSGLRAASGSLDVIGHNIANGNTVGMKAGRAQFAELYATSMGAVGGGTGGIGVELANVRQMFTQGNVTITGNDLDLAINGQGFFEVELTDGTSAYTRAGEFNLNKEGYMVTAQGAKLQGYPAQDGVILSGAVAPIRFPTNEGIEAKATTQINAQLNLNASAAVQTGDLATGFTPPLQTYGTSLVTYDTQGNEVPVSLYFVKTAANTWDVYAKPADVPGATAPMPTTLLGNLTFDEKGILTQASVDALDTWTLEVPNLAATTDPDAPVMLPVSLARGGGVTDIGLSEVTQFASRFAVNLLEQDGNAPGQFTGISIGEDGIIESRYSNGQTKVAGQVTLTNFRNLQALEPQGGGYWRSNSDAGTAVRGTPTTAGFGLLRQGALEESNVDITAELVNMITAQRSYQANAQTIKTQDQIFSTLVNLR
ncbi:flagellar hook protein FlgE [Hydrogenophaga sp. OTU3427]|uniref:flagellar hook protein FlgE n=1 Tax=Hydrogenophaga sp. OTU3427 TaxID=3043856 RepID=UPI00313DB547